MNKIKALLADHNPDTLRLLTGFLKESDFVQVTGSVNEIKKLDSSIKVLEPDVLFMNFAMQDHLGFSWLKNLREYNVDISIVLLTQEEDNLEEVINYQIFSKLSIPFGADDVEHVVKKLYQHLDIADTNEKIKLPVKNGFLFLDHSEILLLEAEGNYTRIVTTLNDEFMSSYNMGRLYKKLDARQFFRINRNCILNSAYLRKIDKKNNIGVVHVNGNSREVKLSNTFITFFNKNFS
ncbi:LytR/AlgR family response regulator transcription factor [Saccharicrinis sp. FJH54]|uniref:LytR/AlgR family response regulator transcription factor n=1 Tax=Saccharicrinis sp. FJH54 TaxID=3344665 RepID=UPI0035D4783E